MFLLNRNSYQTYTLGYSLLQPQEVPGFPGIPGVPGTPSCLAFPECQVNLYFLSFLVLGGPGVQYVQLNREGLVDRKVQHDLMK